MKLYKQSSHDYEDGSKRNIYNFESLQNCDELKKFMILIQNQYGKLFDIIVKKYQVNNEVLFYHCYNDLNEFIKEYNRENIQEFNIYEFLSDNMNYKIDTLHNTLDIYQENIIGADENQTENYEYYRFDSGLIVRFNLRNAHCDYLDDDNRWISNNSLLSMVDDAIYNYKTIENPLETKNK
ncbi:MAG: hypothetical protein HFI86_00405 [Bacilli bacterium]|nr:hypothetical protein [Bacilli bacterium]